MIIIGLNAFHGDSSAALVRDGALIAAAEEERFRREKHWAGFPLQAIRYCLDEAGVDLSDVAHVAINQDSRAHTLRKIGYSILTRPDFSLVLERLRTRAERQGVRELITKTFPSQRFAGKVHRVEHHLSHLSSAFHVSPFDLAAVVSVDGFGDFASAAWGCGEGTKINIEGRVFFPHSLGVFYQAITQFLGFPHYGDEYKMMGLAPYGEPSRIEEMRRIASEIELCHETALAIADGKIVGWFQGRMEWGPRALGNRSILGDPRRADMKEILNVKIKRRESFRPFAPSVIDRAVPQWFEEADDVPFMMQVFQIREEKRATIPAVTHVDGSGRLQTVHSATNPRYYRLIEEFEALTGVPMVLNTSFNENEPVVCQPAEALDCFLRTKMDVLVMGDMMISRNS